MGEKTAGSLMEDHTERFSLFASLPKELRLLIWEACMLRIHGQVLDLSSIMDEGESEDGMEFSVKPPLLSRICQESRLIALSHGRSFRLTYRYGRRSGRTTASFRTWFDGGRDLLSLVSDRSFNRHRGWVFDDEMVALLACTEHLVLQAGPDTHLLEMISSPGASPRLKTINLLFERFGDLEAVEMDPSDVFTFFEGDRVVLIDIDDIHQARATLNEVPSWPHSEFWTKDWLSPFQSEGEEISDLLARAKTRVVIAWLEARLNQTRYSKIDEVLVTEDRGSVPDMQISWVKDVMALMPQVFCVRYCEWPYAEMDLSPTNWTWRMDASLKQALTTVSTSITVPTSC